MNPKLIPSRPKLLKLLQFQTACLTWSSQNGLMRSPTLAIVRCLNGSSSLMSRWHKTFSFEMVSEMIMYHNSNIRHPFIWTLLTLVVPFVVLGLNNHNTCIVFSLFRICLVIKFELFQSYFDDSKTKSLHIKVCNSATFDLHFFCS